MFKSPSRGCFIQENISDDKHEGRLYWLHAFDQHCELNVFVLISHHYYRNRIGNSKTIAKMKVFLKPNCLVQILCKLDEKEES